MTTYPSGTAVRSGYYLRARTLSVALVANDGDLLAGPEGARFVRVPWPLVLVLAPMLSLLFLVLFPVVGVGLLAYALARRLSRGGRRVSAELASTVNPGWRPGEAHLAGKPGDEHAPPAGADAKTPAELEKLARELAGRREAERSE
jgi:hypothetical protein